MQGQTWPATPYPIPEGFQASVEHLDVDKCKFLSHSLFFQLLCTLRQQATQTTPFVWLSIPTDHLSLSVTNDGTVRTPDPRRYLSNYGYALFSTAHQKALQEMEEKVGAAADKEKSLEAKVTRWSDKYAAFESSIEEAKIKADKDFNTLRDRYDEKKNQVAQWASR